MEESTPMTLDLVPEPQSRDRRAQKGADPRSARSEAVLNLPAQNEPVLMMTPSPEATKLCDSGGFGPALRRAR